MVGPLTQKIRSLESEKGEYLQAARKDIATRRAMHNAQIQAYDQEIKPIKRKARITSIRENFAAMGSKVGKMGPM